MASKYNALQKKASELIGAAKSISQFLDRDADPTFASTVVIPAFMISELGTAFRMGLYLFIPMLLVSLATFFAV